MKAAYWHGHKDIRIREVPEPETTPGTVKIRVAWAGICGTDRHEYTGPNFIPTTKPHRLTRRTAPLVMGHEYTGEVVEAAPDVRGWAPGTRVTASGTLCCGECPACVDKKRPNVCEKLGFTGVSTDGASPAAVEPPPYTNRRHHSFSVPTSMLAVSTTFNVQLPSSTWPANRPRSPAGVSASGYQP